MPEEELTELPKEKEKTEIFKKIELKHMLAIAVLSIVVLWMYSSSKEFQTLIQQNAMWIILIIGGIAYWLFEKGKVMPIGMIKAESLCGQWVEYKQKRKEMPDGVYTIGQSKRKQVDENPKDYFFDVEIDSDNKPNSFLVSVDSKTGDITMSEPAIITRLSTEDEAKDIHLKKRVVTGETEYEEI